MIRRLKGLWHWYMHDVYCHCQFCSCPTCWRCDEL